MNWLRKIAGKAEKLMPDKVAQTVKEERPAKFITDVAPGNMVDVRSAAHLRGSLIIKGTGNKVFFDAGVRFSGDLTIQGNNNEISLGADSVVRGRLLLKGKKQRLIIGRKTTFGSVYILCQEDCNVEIGNWCMFSRDVEIRTTDAHSVVDVNTGNRINTPSSIIIGDHVWVGVGAMLSKGTRLAADSIVGAYAFVNRSFEQSNVIVAGTPAKVVKEGITWHRSRKAHFTEEELAVWRSDGLE